MDFRKQLLECFGAGRLKFGSSFIAVLFTAVFIYIFPSEYSSTVSLSLLVAILPLFAIFSGQLRNEPHGDYKICLDKVIIFLILLLFDFFGQDMIRIFSLLIVLTLIFQIHFLQYDLTRDSIKSIVLKVCIILLLASLITFTLNIGFMILYFGNRFV